MDASSELSFALLYFCLTKFLPEAKSGVRVAFLHDCGQPSFSCVRLHPLRRRRLGWGIWGTLWGRSGCGWMPSALSTVWDVLSPGGLGGRLWRARPCPEAITLTTTDTPGEKASCQKPSWQPSSLFAVSLLLTLLTKLILEAFPLSEHVT